MKNKYYLYMAALFLGSCSRPLDSPERKSSYLVGFDMGESLHKQGLELDEEALLRGVADGMRGRQSVLSSKETQEARNLFQGLVASRRMDESRKNALGSAEFLEKNKANPGWTTTSSGLQYKVLKEGSGKRPGEGSVVLVHYVGTLLDGTKFDSSRDRGAPMEFRVGQLIPGWNEALKLMRKGSRFAILLPPALGYGEKGGGPIPPNAALLFDLELVEVK